MTNMEQRSTERGGEGEREETLNLDNAVKLLNKVERLDASSFPINLEEKFAINENLSGAILHKLSRPSDGKIVIEATFFFHNGGKYLPVPNSLKRITIEKTDTTNKYRVSLEQTNRSNKLEQHQSDGPNAGFVNARIAYALRRLNETLPG